MASDKPPPVENLQNFLTEEVLCTVQSYFEIRIVQEESGSLSFFLNARVHELFHYYAQTICCKGVTTPCSGTKSKGKLTKKQFDLLFENDPSVQPTHETKDDKGRILQYCICPLVPKSDIDVTDLDFTLINCLITTCGRTPAGHPQWLRDILDVRNVLSHLGNTSSITADQVEAWWGKLENAAVNMAGTIGAAHQKGLKRRISKIKTTQSKLEELKELREATQSQAEELKELREATQSQAEELKELREDLKSRDDKLEQILTSIKSMGVNIDGVYFRITTSKDQFKLSPDIAVPTSSADPEKCIVVWKFYGNADWSISDMQKKLECINTIGDFHIVFVHEGSLIVHTTIDRLILYDVGVFKEAVEEFLLLFTKRLKIPETREERPLDVVLLIWDDDTNFTKYDKTAEVFPEHRAPSGMSLGGEKTDTDRKEMLEANRDSFMSDQLVEVQKSGTDQVEKSYPNRDSFIPDPSVEGCVSMAEAISSCDICLARQTSRPAVVWCKHCSEALCGNCREDHSLSKGTGNHSIVAITDYQKLPPDVLKITDICPEHDDKYVMYCQNHLQPCCRVCVVQNHKNCKDVAKLEDVIQNYKSSVALQEVEDSLIESNKNLKKLEADRKTNLKSIETDSQKALDEVEKVRREINKHLDFLQDKIKIELKQKEEKTRNQILDTLASLTKDKTFIDNNLQTLTNVRRYASDLQAFLYFAKIEKQIHGVENRLLKLNSGSKINIKVEPSLTRFTDQIKCFGKVEISTSPSSVVLSRKKEAEAQLMIPRNQNRRLDDINLTVDKTIDDIGRSCNGCCILTDGRMAFTNFKDEVIRLFNTNGTEDKSISTPGWPIDVTQVNDTTLAVSGHGSGSGIHLIDAKKNRIVKSFPNNHLIYGMTARDENHLIYCESGTGVRMINITDGTVTDIVKEKLPVCCYVTAFGDNVIYTNNETNTVTCHDLNGKKKWSFKDECVLRGPRDITTDRSGNVYVAGFGSANVVILSPDGQNHKEVKCGPGNISSLDYDKINDKLLVAQLKFMMFSSGKAVIMKRN